MAEVDAELLERVARWCAEAGRHAGTARIRRALAPLSWDELLAVRAFLADAPPTRPLGPFALADMARGAPADVAAEREREGRYPSDADEPTASAKSPSALASLHPHRARPIRRGAGVVIRRARDVTAAAPRPAPPPPPLKELFRPEGRNVLERLVRTHGARRPAIAAALAAGWRREDGAPPGDEDLTHLLDVHGLTRAFERRERDELLHALRAAGGVRAAAAALAGLDPAALDVSLRRLGATEQAERIRTERRNELRARRTLTQRVRLLLEDEDRLRDLDLLSEFEEDLRARLPEHIRALRAGRAPVVAALARSLSVTPSAVRKLAARFGLNLGEPPARPRQSAAAAKRPRTLDRRGSRRQRR